MILQARSKRASADLEQTLGDIRKIGGRYAKIDGLDMEDVLKVLQERETQAKRVFSYATKEEQDWHDFVEHHNEGPVGHLYQAVHPEGKTMKESSGAEVFRTFETMMKLNIGVQRYIGHYHEPVLDEEIDDFLTRFPKMPVGYFLKHQDEIKKQLEETEAAVTARETAATAKEKEVEGLGTQWETDWNTRSKDVEGAYDEYQEALQDMQRKKAILEREITDLRARMDKREKGLKYREQYVQYRESEVAYKEKSAAWKYKDAEEIVKKAEERRGQMKQAEQQAQEVVRKRMTFSEPVETEVPTWLSYKLANERFQGKSRVAQTSR